MKKSEKCLDFNYSLLPRVFVGKQGGFLLFYFSFSLPNAQTSKTLNLAFIA